MNNTAFDAGWVAGWNAYESFIEQKIMERDPGFLAWLDKMDKLSRLARECEELELQQQHMAAQAADDDNQ